MNIEQTLQDLESRLHEVENYRNPSSVEGRIETIFTRIEELQTMFAQLKGECGKMHRIVTEQEEISHYERDQNNEAIPVTVAEVKKRGRPRKAQA